MSFWKKWGGVNEKQLSEYESTLLIPDPCMGFWPLKDMTTQTEAILNIWALKISSNTLY